MLLIYTHKITPRVTYIFKHIFENMLGNEVGFTSTIESFVAHSGPKFSYTEKPLGDEVFVASYSLLFEQGLFSQKIEVGLWDELPVFFKTNLNSICPYDIFAASFFLLSRYEEALPHIKTASGHFNPSESIASQNNFLEKPIIDLWVAKFQNILGIHFEELNNKKEGKPYKELLVEVPLAFRYQYRSPLVCLRDFFTSVWQLKYKKLIAQIFVLLRLEKDPYDSYDSWKEWFKYSSICPKVFFLFSKSSQFQSTISIFNLKYRKTIKDINDFFPLGVLVSIKGQLFPKEQLTREKKDFQNLTHRILSEVRLSNGIIEVTQDYTNLANHEFMNDYSMGYEDRIGFRAGTASPFYFYDVSNEFQLPLKVNPIFATEKGIRNMKEPYPFQFLEELFEKLPLASSNMSLVLTNGFLNPNLKNESLQKGFQDYIHD